MIILFRWVQPDADDDTYLHLYIGAVCVGWIRKIKSKSGRYCSEVYTPIDAQRAVVFYSGSDKNAAMEKTQDRVMEFFKKAGLTQ